MAGLNDPLTQLDYGEAIARGPQSVTQQTGLAGLAAPMSTDIARARQGSLQRLQDLGNVQLAKPPAPAPAAPPRVLAISRSTGNVWANGKLFSLDDAQGAIESEQYLGGPPQPAPAAVATDWEPLSEEAYAQYIGQIKNPSLTTLASKGFGTGIDTSQMLAGYGLQFLGATETGQGIVRQQLEDIRKNAPYQRTLEDIPERGVVEWFVANLAQQGPNLVESAVTAAIGAAAGAAAGGGANPFTAAGGAITSMVGKQAFKQAVLTAAKKYAAGEALDAAESKLLREAAGLTVAARKELFDKVGKVTVNEAGEATLFTADDAIRAANNIMGPAVGGITAAGRQQALTGGAALATGLQNYATGVSEMYGEGIQGGTPDRALAALAGVPYAAAETLPEYIAALRLFKGLGLKAAKAGARGGRAGTIATNVGIGTGAGAVLEGTTEAFQETLGIGMNADVDIDSPEGISRLLNAFAAGAAIGGFIGGASSLNTGKATDLLSAGTKPAEQGGATLTGEVMPPEGPAPRGVPTPDGSVPLLGGPTVGALPGPTPAPTPDVSGVAFAQPQVGAAPAAQALPPATTIYAGAPAPTLELTGPAPQPPAPQPPAVIPMGGPERFGSALEQAAAGGLPQAAPTGPLANRLQQQAADARARAVQAQLEATSGSALARIGRGEAIGGIPPRAPAQQLELPLAAPSAGKLKRGRRKTAAPATQPMEISPAVTQTAEPALQVAEAAPAPAVTPHDTFIEEFDDARLNDANKLQLRAIVKRAVKAGVLTERDTKELDIAFKDRDMTADDIAPLASSLIQQNKEQASAAQVGQVEQGRQLKRPKDRGRLAKGREDRNVPAQVQEAGRPAGGRNFLAESRAKAEAEAKQPGQVSPKAEGAAAAPSKKAEKVSADILRDAGFTESEIRDYQSEGRYAERAAQAAKGYAYISGEWRAVTQADLDGLKAAAEQYRTETMPKLRERIKKAFADARARRPDFGPNGKLANVPYSDGPAVTEAEAYRMIETDFSIRALAKLERQYALTDEAKEAAKPKQALAVVEPKKPVEDVEAKRKAAKVAAEQAEIEALASRALSDQAEVEALIEVLDYQPPESQEYADALQALLGFSKDAAVRKPRQTAIDYLKTLPPEEIKVAERAYVIRYAEDMAREARNAERVLKSDASAEAKKAAKSTIKEAERAAEAAREAAGQQMAAADDEAFRLITTTIGLYNSGQITMIPQTLIAKLRTQWSRIKDKGLKYGEITVDGKKKEIPLSAFITGGAKFFNFKGGKIVPEGYFSISQFDNPDSPVPAGRIKLIIQKFTSKLAVKPEVYVFRNQADLKASNPKLYTKMKAGRAAADFDTAVAAGYSLNDTVIIFSDRIGSEDHLAFVLAHETLGHFGFRGLMGNYDFNILMEKLYDSDRQLRAVVDITMNVRGLPKAEAVEEYLADYAGQLNTRLVLRFWKGVKTVLNRFGIKFGDEATRYLLDQSKRYVRTGQKAGVFNTSSVMQRLWAVEHGQMGRFNTLDMSDDNIAASGAIRSGSPYIPRNMKDAAGKLLNFNMSWDKFKETFFSLFNYQALRNPGLYEFRRLVDETTNMEQAIFNQYNERLARVFNRSEADKSAISKVLMEGRIIATNRLLNKPMTPKDRREPLFEINPNGELVRLDANIKRFIERGILTFDELKNGTTYVREYISEDGGTFSRKETFAGIKDLTQEQYDDYVLIRQTIAQVEMDLLEAKYKSLLHTKGTVNNAISRLLKTSKAQGAMKAVVDKATKRHRELYIAGMEADPRGLISLKPEDLMRADDFLAAVNKAIISSDAKNDPEVRAFFDDQKQADDFLADLEQFRADRKVPDNELTYLFQNQIKQLILEDVGLTKEDEMAKRTMAGGYVPFIRDNPYEVRIEAVDANGNAVRLHEDHKKLLVYSQMETIADAKGAADILATEFKDKNYTALVRQDDGSYKAQQISLRVRYGEAITKLAADPGLNLDEFMHGLRLFQIDLPPDKMKKIITTLTEAGDPLRKKLEFANVPGIDKTTGIYAMAKHIQARGAIIAKTTTRPMMRDLMDLYNAESREKWAGNPQDVIKKFNAWNSATDPDYKRHLRHQLDHALFMFRQTVPGSKDWDGSRAQYDKLKGGWAQTNMNRFYNTAQKHLDFLQDNTLATESDFNVGKLAGKVRGFTTVIQLGGSIAQGVMNLASPYTNWMPYMMSYNARNGFGGGFGMGAVVAEYHRALGQVGLSGLRGGEYNTAMFYENMVNDPAALARAGLTAEEAAFLAQEIKEGKLIPAQANALLGAARMDFTNRYALKALDLYMAPFNLSEQASRRAAALAAFRLMNRRLAGSGLSQDKRIQAARDFSIQSLDFALGEYNMMNRPPAWRDGIGSFLFMYKVFATTTIQMLARLDRKGQLAMLGALWLLAGVEGWPFAEDLEDLIDTIAQALGLSMGSVRAEFAKTIEGIAPGLSPTILKGFVNGYIGLPADVAAKFSQGDFVPGTGALLAGASVIEEFKDIAGPMPAAVLGTAAFARDLIAMPFSEATTFQGTLRGSPVTAMRMIGDSWAYLENGAIVDKRGYVVSPEMSMGTLAARLLGFYPRAAAEQYDAIRLAKRIGNYQKEMTAHYRYAWVKADLTGNAYAKRQIEREVEDWNKSAKGTGLEINDFVSNSQRAAKEARMSATQRTLRSSAKAAREDLTTLTDYIVQ